MRIIQDYKGVPPDCRGAVVALGNFDGVHCGHRRVIEEAGAIATRLGALHGVLTFEPHPRRFFAPDEPSFEITPPAGKTRRLRELGVEAMFLLHFDANFAAMSAEAFVAKVLVQGFSTPHVVTGYDFVFGHGRKGNVDVLRTLGAAAGMDVTVVDAVTGADGEACSSTTIRNYIRDGRPERAAGLLGRCWEIEGQVETGDRRGSQIGFPTANIDPGQYVEPALGVYAVWAGLESGRETVWHAGVANIGRRPTFDGEKVIVEVYIFDFSGDIYGHMLRVALVQHLRPERKFDGLPAIRAQIAKDCQTARDVLDALPDGDVLGRPGRVGVTI